MVHFTCSCGRSLVSGADSVGRPVRCPGCGSLLTVPAAVADQPAGEGAEEATAPGPPAEKLAAGAGRRSGAGWLVGAAVLLLGGAGAGLAYRLWQPVKPGPGAGPGGLFAAGPGALTNLVDWVPGDAIGFLYVRLADCWDPESVREAPGGKPGDFEQRTGLAPADVDRAVFVLLRVETFPGDPPPFWFLLRTRRPYAPEAILAAGESDAGRPLRRVPHVRVEPDGVSDSGKHYYVSPRNGLAVHFADPTTLVVASSGLSMGQFLDRRPDGVAGDAFADVRGEVDKHPLVVALHVPSVLAGAWKADLPAAFRPYEAVLDARRPSATVDVGGEAAIRLPFSEARQAREAGEALRVLLGDVRGALARRPEGMMLRTMLPCFRGTLDHASVEVRGADVVIRGPVNGRLTPGAVALMLPMLEILRKSAGSWSDGTSLGQVGQAMEAYRQELGAFPPRAALGADGRPLLSWRVEILPFLEGGRELDRFHHDEAWSSRHNMALFSPMPPAYVYPTRRRPRNQGYTAYQVFVGPGAPFRADARRGPTAEDFRDGTANTILIAEADQGVPWTKPADLAYHPDRPLPALGGWYPGVFHAVMADGSVRRIRQNIDEKVLRALITSAGGEKLPPGWAD